MANAAAKKAAAGKASAEHFYRPFLLGVNAFYIAWRCLIVGWDDLGIWLGLIVALLGGCQYFAYQGIMQQASQSGSSGAVSRKASSSSKALVGGSHLDLLGLVLAIQFGAVFVSTKVYYLVALLPIWGAYTVHQMWFKR